MGNGASASGGLRHLFLCKGYIRIKQFVYIISTLVNSYNSEKKIFKSFETKFNYLYCLFYIRSLR